ncbi:efflux transporter periplasmic adaptor subunit, partial [Acinetobacter baumannii]
GLKVGDRVVVEGIERIKPNQKLALAAWKAPAVANHASSVETKTSIAEGAQP